MATVVKYNDEEFTATVEDEEKFQSKVLIVKDSRYPSLFFCKMQVGPSPEEFNPKFTDISKAVAHATQYISDMKITQAAKNEMLQKRRDKRKEEIKNDATTKESNTVR